MIVLNNLQERNNLLKSKLLHEQLKCGNYSFNSFKLEMIKILKKYTHNKSIIKSAMMIGADPKLAMNWYIEGQKGNPQYRFFYLRINHINNFNQDNISQELVFPEEDIIKNYEITQYGGSWCYTTYVDDEKISFITGDFESLENKVKSRNLPFD